jgi:hypothetical protein
MFALLSHNCLAPKYWREKVRNMKLGLIIRLFVCVIILLSCFSNRPAAGASKETGRSPLDPNFERFVAEKWTLTKKLAAKHEVSVSKVVLNFFDAVQKNDWHVASNHFEKIKTATGREGGAQLLPLVVWGPVLETFGAYEQFHTWNPGLLRRFGNEISQKVPAGSLYFGGTDAGRFIISALSASHTEGRPFFTVTQNALADLAYLNYLRDIFGEKIYVPTTNDAQQAFAEYLDGAQKRLSRNQLREEESVKIVDNRVQVSGQAGVMAINELLVNVIIDKNPAREIYLEESRPLESLYGQSVPHGLIFKLDHQPLKELPQVIVEADHKFWTDECNALVGKVVEKGSSVGELCSWVEQHFSHPDPAGFGPNPDFVKDKQAPQYFSQCRSAIAGYYQWWSKKSDKPRADNLAREADFAHLQAVSLSPYNPAVVWRYVDFLLQSQRTNDAKALIVTVLRIQPEKRMDIDSDLLKGALKKLRAEAKRLSL